MHNLTLLLRMLKRFPCLPLSLMDRPMLPGDRSLKIVRKMCAT